MPPPPSSVEEQIQQLTRRLDHLEARLAAMEARPPGAADEAAAPVAAAAMPALAAALDPFRVVTDLGRALIIVGGAFLLRALTQSGTWPPLAGVSMGLLYALVFTTLSTRAAGRGDRLRAIFDGGTGLLIGFPLILEAAVRFHLFPGVQIVLVQSAFTAIVLLAASQSRLPAVAWLAGLAGATTGAVLAVRTGLVAPFSFYFTSLGVGALWLGYLREWRGLRWPLGAVAVLAVSGVTLRALAEPPVDSYTAAWRVQAFLVVAYLVSIAIRTLVRGRQVILFEFVQTILVVAVGLGGAIVVGRSVGSDGHLLGGFIIGFSLAAYAVAFQFLAKTTPGALNFHFYGSLALAAMMLGIWVAFDGAARAMALTAFGVALAVAWVRSRRVTLAAHLALALAAASEASGLLSLAGAAFVGAVPAAEPSLWPALLTYGVVLAVSAAGLAQGRGPKLSVLETPGLALASVVVAGMAGMGTLAGVALMGAVVGADSVPPMVATFRTAVLSALMVACALIPPTGRCSLVGRLAYPLLAVTGLKLVVVDLRHSEASTLFAALACYGAALVLVPRLRKRHD